MKYVCDVCGWEYDEELGCPEKGIAPGTPWSVHLDEHTFAPPVESQLQVTVTRHRDGKVFVPSVLDRTVYDQIVTVTDQEAYQASRMLGRCEGLFVGISSGAALHAAIQLAQKPGYEGKTIVALLPDTGERYLSTPMLED